LIWQLNDCWPVQSWALIDSKGNLKAAAYELKRVHDDILFSLVRDDDKFVLWGINDGSETQDLPISLSAVDLQSGDIRLSESADASLASGERRQLLELSIRGLASPEAIVFGGSRSRRTWQLAGEPKNARFAKPGTLTVSNAEDGYLQVLADGPVVDLFLTEHGSTRSFEDNFLTSPSSAVMKVPVKAPIGSLEARSLSGRHKIRFVPGRLA
jgi:beta-mannosidase